jgi:predicted methyltransferase
MIRTITLSALLALALSGCGSGNAADRMMADVAAIRAAVASGQRTPDMRERDAGRKPVEVLSLSGIRIGDHVLELGSFGQYYSTLLATVIGPNGKLDMFDPPNIDAFAGDASQVFTYSRKNVEYHVSDYATADFPSDVDVAYLILFYHDLVAMGVDTPALDAKVFDALKPGGTFLVVDHKAEAGSGKRDAGTLHRIDPQTIIDEVTGAGFELEKNSDLLANPDDPHTAGVFTMRGTTDRAVLLFRKPE